MNTAPHIYDRQTGATLVIALILLLVMTILGISTMSTAGMDIRMAANKRFAENAFQLAETGIETAIQQINAAGVPPAPGPTNCPVSGTIALGPATTVPSLNGTFQSGTDFCGESPDYSGASSLGKITQFHYRTDSQGVAQSGSSSLNRQGFFIRGPGGSGS